MSPFFLHLELNSVVIMLHFLIWEYGICLSASPAIISEASRLRGAGFGIKDSLHIACAHGCNADFFMTVDKGILAKRTYVVDLRIINPLEFINSEE
jgi:predicted nucleic acid-binding protein